MLFANSFDQVELGFKKVGVLLFISDQLSEQVARGIVTGLFALTDGRSVQVQRFVLNLQVVFDALDRILADLQMTDVLQIGQTAQQQDALDDDVGVFHFINGRIVFKFGQLVQPPVLVHARVQKNWLMAVSSALRAWLRREITSGLPFIANNLAKTDWSCRQHSGLAVLRAAGVSRLFW